METRRARDKPIILERNTLDVLTAILHNVGLLILIVVVIVIVIIGGIYARTRYKIAKADEVLVVTGGKKGMRTYPGGGRFVSPFQKHQFFPLGVMTVESTNQETQTSTLVPVVVRWTAQVRPDTDTTEGLATAIIGFSGMGNDNHISNSLQQTLDGEIRAVVATLTPEEVVTGKDAFAKQVLEGVSKQMSNLGFKLVSLNIAEVSDNNGYYKNMAAADREAQRQKAETLTAEANQRIAVAQAAANQISESAALDKDLAVAAKGRDVDVQKAGYKVEVDRAEKDAEYSGQIQGEDRSKELAARKGEVKVIEVQQAQAAAMAQREVELTEADTAKQKLQIEADAAAQKLQIEANAAAGKLAIDTKAEADAAEARALGVAQAAAATAKGAADAMNFQTDATAKNEKDVGLAKADVIRAQGEAEASAILARGEAEAKAQLKLAEALAANDGANLHVALATIESNTRITIATETATVMAEVGKNAKFVDMGGSSISGGNLLTDVLNDFPGLLAKLDLKSDALNGASFGGSLGAAIAALRNGGVAVPAEVSAPAEPVTPDAAATLASAHEEQLAPSEEASRSSEAPTVEPVATVVASASAEAPAPAEAPLAVSAEAINQVVAPETLEAILADADTQGLSLDDLAARHGLDQSTLENILSEKFTPSELLEKGWQFGKKTQSSRRKR